MSCTYVTFCLLKLCNELTTCKRCWFMVSMSKRSLHSHMVLLQYYRTHNTRIHTCIHTSFQNASFTHVYHYRTQQPSKKRPMKVEKVRVKVVVVPPKYSLQDPLPADWSSSSEVYMCVCVCVCACVPVFMYVRMHACKRAWMCVCVCVCMWVFVRIYRLSVAGKFECVASAVHLQWYVCIVNVFMCVSVCVICVCIYIISMYARMNVCIYLLTTGVEDQVRICCMYGYKHA